MFFIHNRIKLEIKKSRKLEKNTWRSILGEASKYLEIKEDTSFFRHISVLLFIFGHVRSSLLCVGFLQLQQAGAPLRCGAQPSHCSDFSCFRAQAPGTRASVVVALRLNSFGVQAQQLWHMGSVVVAQGLSCSEACGNFPDQGLKLCPLYWQVASYPL